MFMFGDIHLLLHYDPLEEDESRGKRNKASCKNPPEVNIAKSAAFRRQTVNAASGTNCDHASVDQAIAVTQNISATQPTYLYRHLEVFCLNP